MMFRCLLALGLLAAVCSAMPDCHLRELDICASGLAVFGRPIEVGQFGDYGNELDKRCEMVDDVFDCVGNYTDECFKDLQIELYDHLMRGVKKTKSALCNPDSQIREEYMRHIPCMQTELRPAIRPCVNDLKAGIEAIINAKWNRRLDLSQCVIQRFRSCYQNELESVCGIDARIFVQKISRVMFSRFPEYFFAEATPGSKMCQDLPPEGSPLTGAKSRYKLMSRIMSYMKRQ